MLEINFVPNSLRRKRRPKAETQNVGMPKETFIGVTALFIIVLIVVAVLLQVVITTNLAKSQKLKKELDQILPQKINADRYVTQIKDMRAKLAPIEKMMGGRDILWSRKLNEISDNLPRGVWLTRMAMEEDLLLNAGSAVSKNQVEMINVHNFNTALKESDVFMFDFMGIDLEMIKSRSVQGTTIADFTIKVDLN